jgi:UDP-N-acetylmuramyl pentapeptide synthase
VIAAGLADFSPPDKRMQMLRTSAGIIVINDAYNANPASMAAGLRTLRHVAAHPVKAIAVIGDMLELGDATASAHYKNGRLAAELNLDHLVLTGEFSSHVKRGARENNMPAERIHDFENKEMAINWLKTQIADNLVGQRDVILVKASRGRRFETVVEALLKESSTS